MLKIITTYLYNLKVTYICSYIRRYIRMYLQLLGILTCAVMFVRFKLISSRTFTVITTWCIDTFMRTITISIITLIDICNEKVQYVYIASNSTRFNLYFDTDETLNNEYQPK